MEKIDLLEPARQHRIHAHLRRCAIVLIVGLGPVAAAVAADGAAFDGEWAVSFQSTEGKARAAKLVLTAEHGTWRYIALGAQGKNPCFTQEYPVAIKSRSDDEIVFSVAASTVMQGCTDLTITAHKTGPGVLDGTLANGQAIHLTKN